MPQFFADSELRKSYRKKFAWFVTCIVFHITYKTFNMQQLRENNKKKPNTISQFSTSAKH